MIPKNIDQITEEALQLLKENAVLEGKTIEYKEELQIDSDSDKKKFLAQISSFANAVGGDLVIGITEEGGVPKSIDGLDIEDIDKEKLKIENIIRDGIPPRIIGIQIQPISLRNSKVVLIIRVPNSWNSPHRVIYGGHDKFYARNSSGKYPMDVAELRNAFNLSETVAERIRRFNIDRASKIISGETPVPLCDCAKIALHILPLVSFHPARFYNLTPIATHPNKFSPIYSRGWNHRYNLDGLLTYSPLEDGKCDSYAQLFRSGIIEAVNATLLCSRRDKRTIPSGVYEKMLIESFDKYISILKELVIEPPFYVFLDMFGVRDYSMAIPDRITTRGSQSIDRDMLLLPEIVVENYDVSAENVLKPVFDSVWNACGFSRSFNYDEAGNWIG